MCPKASTDSIAFLRFDSSASNSWGSSLGDTLSPCIKIILRFGIAFLLMAFIIVILSYLRLFVKRFQEPQGSIVKKLSQINKLFDGGDGSKTFGGNFAIALESDTKAISDYAFALTQLPVTAKDAFSLYVESASSEAQNFVKANQAMFESASDWFNMGKRFKTQALMKQLGKSVDGSFTGAINAIRLYNSGLKTAGLTQKEFHEAIAEANPELDAYITKMEADGKKPTEWGYIWATKQAAIETALFTSAIAAGQLALNAVAKNADPQAAKIVGALTSVAGGITAVVSAIAMAEGALSLTAGVVMAFSGDCCTHCGDRGCQHSVAKDARGVARGYRQNRGRQAEL